MVQISRLRKVAVDGTGERLQNERRRMECNGMACGCSKQAAGSGCARSGDDGAAGKEKSDGIHRRSQ